jgi:uncharacterized membrane protein AbrB (regulator of aidB expression)
MSLVALGIGIEVAFVAAHHIARVFIVVAGAGLIVGLLNKSGDR